MSHRRMQLIPQSRGDSSTLAGGKPAGATTGTSQTSTAPKGGAEKMPVLFFSPSLFFAVFSSIG